MKRSFNWITKNIIPVMATAVVIAAFSSCLKTDDNPVNIPTSGVMTLNLATDQSGIDFVIDGNRLNNLPIAYPNFSGTYQGIYTGSRTIDTYNHNLMTKLTSSTNTFEQGKYYSVFLVGRDTTYANIVTEDNLDSLHSVAGKAYVRYINAVSDSTLPVVKIISGGSDIFNGQAVYKTVSEFKPVNAGQVSVSISNESATINANRNITLEDQKIYTVLLVGKPGAIAGSPDSVQVRFITNGTILP